MLYSFIDSETLSLNSDISAIADDIYQLVYKLPYKKNNLPRFFHGIDHVSRAMFLGTAGYNLIHEGQILNSQNVPIEQRMQEQKLIQIALLLHDSGREDDGEDLWDDDSAINTYRYFTTRLKVDPKMAQRVVESLRNKDWETGELYKKFNADVESFKEIEKIETISPSMERVRLAIQYGDCIDIQRVRDFDSNYLLLKKNYPDNSIIQEETALIINEGKTLIRSYQDASKNDAFASYNGKNAFLFIDQCVQSNNGALNRLQEVPQETRAVKNNILQQPSYPFVNNLQVITELKSGFKNDELEIKEEPAEESFLSQSELHMKAILGNDYIADDLRGNTEKMLILTLKSQGITLTEDKFKNLLDHCENLIKKEKEAGPDTVFFYHAVPNETAFLYEIYTAVHKLLQINPDKTVLRLNNLYYKPFMNIDDFIKAYTDQFGNIQDSKGDYREIALSGNWGLFGCHVLPGKMSSSSLAYFLNNRASDKLGGIGEQLKLFLPENLSEDILKSLEELYKNYYHSDYGVLYQVAMSASVADENAYLAKAFGNINPYNHNIKPSQLRKSMENDLEKQDPIAIKYLEDMELRFMMPPHLDLNIEKITGEDVSGTPPHPLLNMNSPLLSNLANEILVNLPKDYLHKNIAADQLLKLQSLTSEKKNVSLVSLKKAIDLGQFDTALQYIKDNPDFAEYAIIRLHKSDQYELLHQIIALNPSVQTMKLKPLKSYDKKYRQDLKNEKEPESDFLINVIAKYNDEKYFIKFMESFLPGWQNNLPEGFTHTSFTLKATAKTLSEDDKIEYIILHTNDKTEENIFRNIYTCFETGWPDSLPASFIHTFFTLEATLRTLQKNEQFLYIKDNWGKRIPARFLDSPAKITALMQAIHINSLETNAYHFNTFVENCLETAWQHNLPVEFIHTDYSLLAALNGLPSSERLAYIQAQLWDHAEYDLIETPEAINHILQQLDQKEAAEFIGYLANHPSPVVDKNPASNRNMLRNFLSHTQEPDWQNNFPNIERSSMDTRKQLS